MTVNRDTTILEPPMGERPVRRFSEGMERPDPHPSTLRVGHFADGLARLVAITPDRIGSFADGPVARRDPSGYVRVGSFGDREAPGPSRRRRVLRHRHRVADATT